MVENKLAIPINNSNELSNVLKFINENMKLDEYKNKLKKYFNTKSDFSKKIIEDILCKFT